MACLNMLNNNEQQPIFHHPSSTPRISFSNDFVDAQAQQVIIKHENSYKEAPVSSDFEFSLSGIPAISADDELIFKGKLLPPKKHCAKTITTLQDELLAENDDDYEDVFAPRMMNKFTSRWKERLGFKRSQVLPSKASEGLERIDEIYTKQEK